MSIFLHESSKVIVQGITGVEGRKHAGRMLNSGTKIVGGVNPRKAGQSVAFTVEGYGPRAETGLVRDGVVKVPVFGSVAEAKAVTDATVSVVFVPPRFAKEAVMEAIGGGMGLVVVVTEGIPVADSVELVQHASDMGVRLIGPNCPGIISPAQSNVGITPADIVGRGPLGLVSKSGTLTYQMMQELSDIGFSTCIGIGGDPVVGTTHIDALKAFQRDRDTDVIVMIGEIGGDAEEQAAKFIAGHVTKPVVGYVAGFTAPEGKTMGHAGAIVHGSEGSAEAKKVALEKVGVQVGRTPSHVADLVREACTHLHGRTV